MLTSCQQLDRARQRLSRSTSRDAATSASAICRPIVSTGLSEVIGSWKIIEISLPRIFRISVSVKLEQIAALEQHASPLTVLPGGDAIRRMIDSDVTLLPQPDSPTIASVSPA